METTETKVKGRIPELHPMGFPAWWHHHGTKMRVAYPAGNSEMLIIAGSAAKVIINKSPFGKKMWLIEWEVLQSQNEKVNGRVIFTKDHLTDAFGITKTADLFGYGADSLIERFGGDCASQGRYIRWKNFLNIPCPGTGHDGDPNVSINIDDEIKKAVEKFLKENQTD
ncbi:MAG: hypothetical protein US50_C0001G0036 [Candidatus Nomurabacteria bacterium GW2011_GWB1_37_5]|uniref:Uncharacterized protein n=1 Tax=Candidatus Nomurabacteria bacterium GW2011_GWB1_37_5 TaxID=1618742 RepID=A0A0G0JGZ9_9BACT|nr:MAG: hypothetical protein US50_C0001G0036 [Candidatus Nomurabacteria bacterium GW2011_GWB1_37_5]